MLPSPWKPWNGIGEIHFLQRDVRPILSSKCFFCHGPSEKSRKADLRLDLEEHSFRELDGLAAFVRNNLEDSEAWHRITSEDPDEVMPPPEFKKELTGKEIETLRQWILQGAKWEGHWAFTPVTKPTPPKNDLAHWARNPIDEFVLANLEERGLRPSPESDRRTLIRRLYFDLTGLPTPEQINQFLLDTPPIPTSGWWMAYSPRSLRRIRLSSGWTPLDTVTPPSFMMTAPVTCGPGETGRQRLQVQHAFRSIHRRAVGGDLCLRPPKGKRSPPS